MSGWGKNRYRVQAAAGRKELGESFSTREIQEELQVTHATTWDNLNRMGCLISPSENGAHLWTKTKCNDCQVVCGIKNPEIINPIKPEKKDQTENTPNSEPRVPFW